MPEKFLTPSQVAKLKGDITERSICRMCNDGLVPGAFKLGRNWAIPERSVGRIEVRSEGWQKGRKRKDAKERAKR